MSRITNAKVYLGSTKQRERYKAYIVGQRGTRGTKEVWIEAGRELSNHLCRIGKTSATVSIHLIRQ